MTDNSQKSFWELVDDMGELVGADKKITRPQPITSELVDSPRAPREPNHGTQQDKILRFMRRHGSITALEAMQEFGIYRLAARIKDLRDKGWRIATLPEPHKSGTHARYTLD
jgi:hypothetical protein|tara:strand:- start:6480 stop:6815 length:336 start_codon:yes stop_codon:yes gene_type:complete